MFFLILSIYRYISILFFVKTDKSSPTIRTLFLNSADIKMLRSQKK